MKKTYIIPALEAALVETQIVAVSIPVSEETMDPESAEVERSQAWDDIWD